MIRPQIAATESSANTIEESSSQRWSSSVLRGFQYRHSVQAISSPTATNGSILWRPMSLSWTSGGSFLRWKRAATSVSTTTAVRLR